MTQDADTALCEAKSWGPGNFQWPCEMGAKWLVEMEGREPIKVCGRHVVTYRREITRWRGTITACSATMEDR